MPAWGGVTGGTGSSVPAGGTTGQVLKKTSNADGDATWGEDVASEGAVADGDKGDIVVSNSGATWTIDSGLGLVAGPASATDNAIPRFDGETGKIVQNSVVTIADTTGNVSGVGNLTATSLTINNGNAAGVAVAVRGHADQTADIFEVQTAAAGELFAVTKDGSTNIPTGQTYNVNGTAHTHSGLAPTGGTTGQVLKKNSDTAYDYAWAADATAEAGTADTDITFTDNTTGNASTSAHGFLVKATAPSSGLLNVVGIANGETAYTNKALFDATNPAALGTAAPGTAMAAARRDHVHAAPALGDLSDVGTATPTNKHTLVGDGDSFESRQLASTDLSDVSVVTGSDDDILQRKSGAWTNRTPTQVTADLIAVVGDSGSGGTKGLVPAPASGDAAANKFLKASGAWAAAALGGAVGSSGLTMATSRVLGRTTASTGAIEELSSVDSFVSAASDSAAGKVELAIASEVTTGTDTGRAITPDALAGSTIFGVKTVQIMVVDATTDCATGDGKAYFVVPAALNGMNLVGIHGRVITAGTTGTMDVQIRNVTDSQDMLSTKLTWDTTEVGTDTAATAAVINTSYDDVATYDLLAVDVDAVHSGGAAKGMILTLTFQLP